MKFKDDPLIERKPFVMCGWRVGVALVLSAVLASGCVALSNKMQEVTDSDQFKKSCEVRYIIIDVLETVAKSPELPDPAVAEEFKRWQAALILSMYGCPPRQVEG